MNRLVVVLFLLQLISGCGLTSQPESSKPSLLTELDKALKAELIQPNSYLSSTIVYGGNSDQVSLQIDYYYPAERNKDYRVIRDRNNDTVSVTVVYLQPSNNDHILKSLTYSYDSGPAAWSSTNEYEYDEEDRLSSIYRLSPTTNKTLSAKYSYRNDI